MDGDASWECEAVTKRLKTRDGRDDVVVLLNEVQMF